MTNRPHQSLILGLLVVACGTPQVTETELVAPGISFYVDGSNGNGICGGSSQEHQDNRGVDGTCYASSPTVDLTAVGGGPDAINVLNAAISAWNVRLEEAKHFNVPVLARAGSGGIPVNFPQFTNGAGYCGVTKGSVSGIIEKIDILKGTYCNNFQRGTAVQALIHELSHVLGLNQGHGGDFARNSPLTGGVACASYIPAGSGDVSLGGHVCYHEVETIIRARNGIGYVYDQTLYTSPLAFGTNVTPRETSVDAGSTVSFAVNNWWMRPSGSATMAASSVEWTSLVPTRVSKVSDGVLKGEQAGVGQAATTVRLTGRASSLPSGHQFWTPFKNRGDSVKVTVTAPPPQPFKVDSIWTNPMPVTQAGSHTIYTHVVSAPGQPVSMRWIITDSRTPSVSDTLWGYGHSTIPSFTFDGNASYMVTFRARPHWNQIIGQEYAQSIPVCTENQQAKGGGSTNAVGGCGGSGGGGENE